MLNKRQKRIDKAAKKYADSYDEPEYRSVRELAFEEGAEFGMSVAKEKESTLLRALEFYAKFAELESGGEFIRLGTVAKETLRNYDKE